MKEIIATMTERGQVTVPAEVRRLLGIKPRDKVAFEVDDGGVTIRPVSFTLESAFASVQPATTTRDLKTVSTSVRDEKATREKRRLRS